LLPLAENLLRQFVEVPEDPQEVCALGEGESDIARADRRQNTDDAVDEFVDPHTGLPDSSSE
jgi:hypothetical protein